MKTFQPYFLVYSIYSDYILTVWWSPMPFNQFKCTCLQKKMLPTPRLSSMPPRRRRRRKKNDGNNANISYYVEKTLCANAALASCRVAKWPSASAPTNEGAEVQERSTWSTHESHDVAFSVFVVVVVVVGNDDVQSGTFSLPFLEIEKCQASIHGLWERHTRPFKNRTCTATEQEKKNWMNERTNTKRLHCVQLFASASSGWWYILHVQY